MAGKKKSFVRIVDVDTSRVRKLFVGMINRSNDFKPVFRWMFQALQKAHMQNFQTQGQTDGSPWKPLDPQYASWKLENYGDKGILVRTGDLQDSLTMNSARGAVRDMGRRTAYFGTKLSYAKFHQNGTINMAERRPVFLPNLMARQTARAVGEHIVHNSVGVVYPYLKNGFVN